MSSTPSNDLQSFHQFIGQQLNAGGVDLAPEEALEMFRSEHPTPDEFARSVAAVQESIDDMEAGDTGRPADDVLRDIRAKYGLNEIG